MKRLFPHILLAAAALAVGIATVRAADQTITFAVPELDGTISLGVYNAEKKLVRTLATGATDKDFQIGLNGLIKTWDGKNDAGEPLPAGKYDVKGYVVGDKVKSEGVAFHFNDWVTDEDSPFLGRPRTFFAAAPELTIFGLGLDGDPQAIISFILDGDQVVGSDQTIKSNPSDKSSIVVERRNSAPTRALKITVLPDSTPTLTPDSSEKTAPSPTPTPDPKAQNSTAIGNKHGSVWLRDGEVWLRERSQTDGGAYLAERRVPLGEKVDINSLSIGFGDTFWVVGESVEGATAGPTFVRQYSFVGEILRQISGQLKGSTIVADIKENRIFLTHVDGETSVIKGLRPATADAKAIPDATDAPKTADWEVFLEKTSTLCPKFGLVDGKLVPDAGTTEQKDGARLDLPPSTMDQKQHTLVVHAKAGKEGEIWLTGSGGLRLALIGKLPGVDRIVVAKGDGPGKLAVYAGNGVVVAEYLVTGLDEIAEINAGEIDLP